jgi:hypothetical protein
MPSKVFISYRLEDARYQAQMIYEAFLRVLPREHVFMDMDSILPGTDIRQILRNRVNECEMLLALIGPNWLNATDPKTKDRRLDNPSDCVRIEIGEALARGIPVVPVLIDGVPMPDIDLLPDDLKELVDRQAEDVGYRTFNGDVERLIRKLKLTEQPAQRPEGRIKDAKPVQGRRRKTAARQVPGEPSTGSTGTAQGRRIVAKVFINYRRDDEGHAAGRIHDWLKREFGADVLFMDVDAIPLGVNFVKVLREEVAKCDVLLALIGPNWLNVRDEEGNRRLDNPADFLRIEIATALQRDIPVIPILLDGTRMPKANQLPKDLEELSVRNGLDIRLASFQADMDKLIRGLQALGQNWAGGR